MKNRNTMLIFIVGALAVAITFGAVAYNSVLAATPSATGTITSSQTNTVVELGRGPMGGYTSEDLATALGITVDELSTAKDEAYAAALSDAVSQGLITQAQADELTTDGSAFPFGGRWGGFLSKSGIDLDTYLAEALNISVDELKAAYQAAYSAVIDQAVTDGALTQEQADLRKGNYALFNDSTFQSSMQGAYTDAVNQAVASGVITQAQADQILANRGNLFKLGMGGMGHPGGRHGPGGDFMGNGELEINP